MMEEQVEENRFTSENIKSYLSHKCLCHKKYIKRIKQYRTLDSIVRIFKVDHDFYKIITDKYDSVCEDIFEISEDEAESILKNF